MSDERFCIESDANGEPTIWRICGAYAGDDLAILRRSDVKDVDLWHLISAAVTG